MIVIVSRIGTAMIAATVACEAPHAEPDPEPAAPFCAADEPVQLLGVSEAEFGEWAFGSAIAGNHAVVSISGFKDTDPVEYTSGRYAIDLCADSVVDLAKTQPPAPGLVGAAGRWVLSWSSGEVRWLDPDGHARSHVVFEAADTCLVRVADGLAVVDLDGTLWFHPDPADSGADAVAIAHDVVHAGGHLNDDFSCSPLSRRVPVADGDAVLVAEQDGPLVRVSIPDGERQMIIDATVAEFAVLEDPRYILWREGIDGSDACCSLNVRDREDGEDFVLGSGTALADRSGSWVSTPIWAPSGMRDSTVFLQIESGLKITLDDAWILQAQLSDDRLLVNLYPFLLEVDGTRILDVATGALVPIDFPAPGLNEPRYRDGVVRFDPGLGWRRGALKILPFDGSEIRVLAEVQTPHLRTQDGIIAFVERMHDDDDTGTLVVFRDGEEHVVDTDVLFATIPFYGSDRELAELIYIVLDPARAGLWRAPLP